MGKDSRVYVADECWTPEIHGTQPGATSLGVWLLQLADVDSVGSKFYAKMRVVFKMVVPELDKLPSFKVAGERTYYDPAVVGDCVAGKQLEFQNGIEVEHLPCTFYGEEAHGLLYHLASDPVNVLEMEVKYQGTFKHIFNLRSFPYDMQVLPIQMKIWCGNDQDFARTWVALGTSFGLNKDHLTFPDWTLDFNIKTQVLESENGRCTAVANLRMQRKPWFYTIAAAVPLLIVVGIALTTFSIDVGERSDRIGHAVTLLLSAVAVKFVVAADVPRVAYATTIDYETLLTYAFLLFVTVVHALVSTPEQNRYAFYAAIGFSIFITLSMAYGPISYWMAQRSMARA